VLGNAPIDGGVEGLRHDFERAARAAGGITERRIELAGKIVCVRFAGAAAAEALGAAFGHLAATRNDVTALTLHVWDAATMDGRRPVFVPPRQMTPEAATTGAGPSYFYEGPGFRALHQPATDALSVLDVNRTSGWFWTPDATGLPYWEYTAPFRHLLSWWLEAHGLRYVHGGAVGSPDGGVLLVGPGGSGKSTSTLAVLADDRLRFAGDDYVAIGPARKPLVYSLYCAAKVHRADLERLSHLEAALDSYGQTNAKVVVDVAKMFPGRTITSFPLRAIVVPRVTSRRAARVIRATHATALRALAPSTIFQLHPPAPRALAQMAELIRTVPAYVLELGTAAHTIPDALSSLLEAVGERS
jgi:hypothetical protein